MANELDRPGPDHIHCRPVRRTGGATAAPGVRLSSAGDADGFDAVGDPTVLVGMAVLASASRATGR
jgi:hypothetical protein